MNADCTSGVCAANHTCTALSCNDKAKNGSETDVDCGGVCPACDLGKACAVNGDCVSGLCAIGKCAATTPIITAVSASGHDRAFGLVLDAQGNVYTTGVVARRVRTLRRTSRRSSPSSLRKACSIRRSARAGSRFTTS